MSSTFGKNIRYTIFGESHGAAVGVVIEGLPPGEQIDSEKLKNFMARRAPGHLPWTTPRRESDAPQFLAGVFAGKTCGTPLAAIIKNQDTHSEDYEKIKDIPRPSHADFPGQAKYKGFGDYRGGGHFSGRLTAPICLAGGICKDILAKKGVYIGAHIATLGGLQDKPFDPVHCSREDIEFPGTREFPVQDYTVGDAMIAKIMLLKKKGNSLGGIIEGCALGLPVGLGEPLFNGLENDLAQAAFGIPAVKGVEFGQGFAAAAKTGLEHNDEFVIDKGQIKTVTNHHGGILGGLSTGMPLIMRLAIKPTPSIALPQKSVNLATGEEELLTVPGRHDPCIVPRAVPVLEAIMAMVILDHVVERN